MFPGLSNLSGTQATSYQLPGTTGLTQPAPTNTLPVGTQVSGSTTPTAPTLAQQAAAAAAAQQRQQISDSVAALTDTIGQDQSQIGSTQAALSNGLTGIQDDFNKNSSRYNQDQTLAQQNYDKQRGTTTQDKLNAQDTIDTGARTLADSVRRILAQASGTHSTAYTDAAPAAIANDTTLKTSANNATYKKNYDAIDNAENDTNLAFQRNIQDLNDKTSQSKSALQSGIEQQLQSIYGDIANNQAKIAQLNGGTYLDGKNAAAASTAKAQAAQQAIDGLFAQYRTPYAYQAVTPTAATTQDYTTQQTNLNQPGNTGTPADSSPYAVALKRIFNGGGTAPAPTPTGVTA